MKFIFRKPTLRCVAVSGWMEYTHRAGDSFNLLKRDAIKRRVMKLGDETIEGTCEMFSVWIFHPGSSKLLTIYHNQKLNGKVSLSLDAWTSSNQHAFLAIVAHYVTNDGQLGSSSSSLIYSSTNFSCLRGTSDRFSWTSWWTFRREYGGSCLANHGVVWFSREGMCMFLSTKKVLIPVTNRSLQSLWITRATMTRSWCLWSNGVRNKVLGFWRERLACAVCRILSI